MSNWLRRGRREYLKLTNNRSYRQLSTQSVTRQICASADMKPSSRSEVPCSTVGPQFCCCPSPGKVAHSYPYSERPKLSFSARYELRHQRAVHIYGLVLHFYGSFGNIVYCISKNIVLVNFKYDELRANQLLGVMAGIYLKICELEVQ
jgi:hypothetical protein